MNQCRYVFIVENDVNIAAEIAEHVRASGHIPLIFPDGRIAIAAVRDDPPAAIILDIELLGMRGVTICDAVREVSSVPILILTGCIEEADILRGFDCAVDGYVCKPFGARQLIARLNEVIVRGERQRINDQANRRWAIDVEFNRAA